MAFGGVLLIFTVVYLTIYARRKLRIIISTEEERLRCENGSVEIGESSVNR